MDKTLRYLRAINTGAETLQGRERRLESDPRTYNQAVEHAEWMRHLYVNLTVRSSHPGFVGEAVGPEGVESSNRQQADTVHIASTPVVRFRIDGSLLNAQQTCAPSLLPVDELVLPAVLGKDNFILTTKESKSKDIDIALEEAGRSVPKSFLPQHNAVPSLFDLALQSAIKTSKHEVVHLPSMLPEDAPATVLRGLKTASDVFEEGGRICSVCSRSYVVPRTEWVEYWHLGKSGSIDKTKIFLPFLRRGCSLNCVPGRNSEEAMQVGLSASTPN